MSIEKITLDTNAIRDLWGQRSGAKAIERLIEINRLGEIELMITRRIYDDIPRAPLADKIDELPEMGIGIGPTIWRLGKDPLGFAVFGSEEFIEFYSEAYELASQRLAGKRSKPPSDTDLDHVHTHFVLRRDIFLTSDVGLLCLGNEFRERFGIIIQRPEDYLRKRENWTRTII